MSIIKNKEGLLLYRRQAEASMEKIRQSNYSCWEELHADLYPYVLSKYILIGEVNDIYELDELAKLSVAKTIRMSKELAMELDGAHSCEGTTSAMNKKVLLLMAIQRELGIQFPKGRTVELTDTKLIAQEVFYIMNKK